MVDEGGTRLGDGEDGEVGEQKAREAAVRGRLVAEALGSVIVVDGESKDEGDTEDD